MAEQTLQKEKHIKYWQRCLKSLLPTAYTSTDSSRMTLGFFILSALDLLGAGADTFSEKQRKEIRDWILKCQHPNGGFCGSPNHKFPDAYYVDVGEGRRAMDPANLPATFFALLSLSFVGGLQHVRRQDNLRWLKSLQREDGSFGELVTQEGVVEGGKDMRYCQTAMAVRWILKGDEKAIEGHDINVEGLVSHIRAGQTYDGGFSESSEHEAHAGYTYCAISALSFLGRLPEPSLHTLQTIRATSSEPGLTDLPGTIRWLVSRQVGYSDEDDADISEEDEPIIPPAGIYKDDPVLLLEHNEIVGLNGRCNKAVDTCYAFWVSASLSLLGHDAAQLLNTQAIRRFLFEKTQHMIGGFGKTPGAPPDIYHSYLGLAALSTMKEPGIKSLDPGLCISMQQKEIIGQLRKSAAVPMRSYWKHGYCFQIREDDPEFEQIMASSEEPLNL
ncbi:prenyltransferase and squalene oxidase [Diplocarpon rosae]|nr:prenyltransferase and squalene oxidase [Diplocarpon rosae]